MKIKKTLAGLLAVAMIGSLAGCGGAATPDASTNDQTAAGGDAGADADSSDDSADTEAAGDDSSSDTAEQSETSDSAESSSGSDYTIPDVQEFKDLYGDEPVTLTCYSQLANYNGELTGWFAELLMRQFNCKINIIPDTEGMFDTRMESGNLGDLVIFGSNGSQYQRAASEGMLFDWNEDDLLSEYGPYIQEHMSYAIENNASFNESFGAGNKVFGFGHNVATSPDDHEAFLYTLDIRWDLYKELNYPKLSTLDDLYDVFVQMKEICPTDDNGAETYAMSLWPDWDGNMVMYIKAFATCYWGYDEMGFGLYDVTNGDFHYALEEDGPYLESLKFFNRLYQAGLIDPNSMTQTYDKMSEKVQASGVFFSIFDYAGSQLYNSEAHLTEGRGMYPVVPDDATPLCYGMNVLGGNRIWSIGANTEYPELVMAIINYLSTPEGYMTYNYGPKDLCWYYDDEGNSCLTELGESAFKDRKGTTMPEEWGGGTFNDGTFQANNTTWSKDATNPDSNGETYNAENWRSRRVDTPYEILQDWRDFSGQVTAQEYMNTVNYVVAPGTSYTESKRSDELELIWQQVAKCIVNYSWKAIYAADDAEYDKIVAEMIAKCEEYDPDGECLAWCENEASIRNALEEPVRPE